MKKAIILFTLCAILILSLTCVSFAEESAEPFPDAVDTPTAETPSEPADVPLTTFISDFLGENAAEILSAVSAVFAAVLCILFKKGLLPTVSSIFGKIGDKTDEVASAAQTAANTAKEISEKANDAIKQMAKKFEEYEGKSEKKLQLYGDIIAIQTEMIGNLMLNLRLSPDQRAGVEKAMQEIVKKTAEGE